jgi:hypothetical protein
MLFQNVFFKTLHLNKKLFEDWIFWGKKNRSQTDHENQYVLNKTNWCHNDNSFKIGIQSCVQSQTRIMK